jgi:acid stress-induced BolA-like protein IbaG/YrbA
MNLEISLVDRGFFFIDDLTLSQATPKATIDLTGKSDHYIITVVTGALVGKLKLNKDYKDLVNLIKSAPLKKRLARQAMVTITEEHTVSVDNLDPTLEVEVIAPEPPTQTQILTGLLEGGVKKVIENISNANLSQQELGELLKIELATKNRSAAKAAIMGLFK